MRISTVFDVDGFETDGARAHTRSGQGWRPSKSMPRALITGIAGQDGAYLSKWLLGHGYEVWGTLRDDKPLAQSPLHALGLVDSVHVVIADLRDRTSMDAAIRSCQPDEIYNLAAQSSVSRSFEFPVETGQTNGIGVASLLSTLRELAPLPAFFRRPLARFSVTLPMCHRQRRPRSAQESLWSF